MTRLLGDNPHRKMTICRDGPADGPLRHDALLYPDVAEYLAGTEAFVRAGLDADEPVLVVVPGSNLGLIRARLGRDGERVRFVDMAVAGANPGCIIPKLLRGFMVAHPGRSVRIVGEPIWPGRSSVEYPACVQHEALVNLAFAGQRAAILCPYDAARLDAEVLADADTTHPFVIDRGHRRPSRRYANPIDVVDAFNQPLPDPPVPATAVRLGVGTLSSARRLVADQARDAGIDARRSADLQLAVNEVATNSLAHSAGPATLSIWREDGHLVCQVEDRGRLDDPLSGRVLPPVDSERGRGLYLVNHLCDLVRTYNRAEGLTVRLYMRPGR